MTSREFLLPLHWLRLDRSSRSSCWLAAWSKRQIQQLRRTGFCLYRESDLDQRNSLQRPCLGEWCFWWLGSLRCGCDLKEQNAQRSRSVPSELCSEHPIGVDSRLDRYGQSWLQLLHQPQPTLATRSTKQIDDLGQHALQGCTSWESRRSVNCRQSVLIHLAFTFRF